MKMKQTKNTKSPAKKTAAPRKTPVAAKRIVSRARAVKPAAVVTAPRQEITTEAIATRAYILWEKDGRPPGRDMEYWLKAESQLKDTQSFSA
jgi:hypothetical protein